MARRKSRNPTTTKATETVPGIDLVGSLTVAIPPDEDEARSPIDPSFNESSKESIEMNTSISAPVIETTQERATVVLSPIEIATIITKGVNERHETYQVRANAVLIREVFEQIRQQIAEMHDGVVAIKGLGTFDCRVMIREGTEGESSKQFRRVIFGAEKGPV